MSGNMRDHTSDSAIAHSFPDIHLTISHILDIYIRLNHILKSSILTITVQ